MCAGRQYEFRVFAQNEAGLSKPSSNSGTIKIVDPKAATPPQIVRPLRNAMCTQNHNAQFTCEITGEPTPTITWYKGAREISNGARYHIYNDGDTYNLTIKDVFGEDADEYICRASNKGGVKSTRAELIIMSMCSVSDSDICKHSSQFTTAIQSFADSSFAISRFAGPPKRPNTSHTFQLSNIKPFILMQFNYFN